jgi:hypothetical protein
MVEITRQDYRDVMLELQSMSVQKVTMLPVIILVIKDTMMTVGGYALTPQFHVIAYTL